MSLVSNAVHILEVLWCVLVDVLWVYGIVWTSERRGVLTARKQMKGVLTDYEPMEGVDPNT